MADGMTRCLLVLRAEAAWRSINRPDLTAELRDEFPECLNGAALLEESGQLDIG
jgi:hypothetical protein